MTAGRMPSLPEAAMRLGVSADAVAALLQQGELKGTHLGGGQWRVSEQSIAEFVQAQRRRSAGLQ
jgi:excisionase family DNA binding protein